jgi:hypothetical protein
MQTIKRVDMDRVTALRPSSPPPPAALPPKKRRIATHPTEADPRKRRRCEPRRPTPPPSPKPTLPSHAAELVATLDAHQRAMRDAIVRGDLVSYTKALRATAPACRVVSRLVERATSIACGTYGCTYDSPFPSGAVAIKAIPESDGIFAGSDAWTEVAVGTLLTELQDAGRLPPMFMRMHYAAACSSPAVCPSDRALAAHLIQQLFYEQLDRQVGEADAARFPRLPPGLLAEEARHLLPAGFLRGETPSAQDARRLAAELLGSGEFRRAASRSRLNADAVMAALQAAVVLAAAGIGGQAYAFVQRADGPLPEEALEAMFVMVVSALLAADRACGFGHCDLHFGNVMSLRRVPWGAGADRCLLRLYDTCVVVPFSGTVPLVIDYGLSTAVVEGERLPRDLRRRPMGERSFGSVLRHPGPAFDVLTFVRSLQTHGWGGLSALARTAETLALYAGVASWTESGRPVMRAGAAGDEVESALLANLDAFRGVVVVGEAEGDSLVADSAGRVVDLRYRV